MTDLYRKKPPVFRTYTFEEFVAEGIATGAYLTNGMPWSFYFQGAPITHENDDRYLIGLKDGVLSFNRGDLLLVDDEGNLSTTSEESFESRFEKVEGVRGFEDKIAEEAPIAVPATVYESVSLGWQLVPTKYEERAGLTHEMATAFYEAFEKAEHRGAFEQLNAGYNAMLRAAPKPPIPAAGEDKPSKMAHHLREQALIFRKEDPVGRGAHELERIAEWIEAHAHMDAALADAQDDVKRLHQEKMDLWFESKGFHSVKMGRVSSGGNAVKVKEAPVGPWTLVEVCDGTGVYEIRDSQSRASIATTHDFQKGKIVADALNDFINWPIEMWHSDRKISIYADEILRVWGGDIEENMSSHPHTKQEVQNAVEWLFQLKEKKPKTHVKPLKDGEEREVRASRNWSMFKNKSFTVVAHRIDCDTPYVELKLNDLYPGSRPPNELMLSDVEASDLIERLQRALAMLPTSK